MKGKFLLVVIALITLGTGCAGRAKRGDPVLEKEPCDAVANRERQYVCGKDRVRRDCSPVVAEPQLSVCHEL